MLSALAGKTHWDRFVGCCLLWKQVNIWLYLQHALMDFNQSWVIDATWEPSFVDEVKGHILRLKVIWGQVVRLVENVKVASFKKLKSDGNQTWLLIRYNMGTFICSCGLRSYTKVKGHLRSSFKIGWKCDNGLIWKVEVWFEPNLVYGYNIGHFVCTCDQRSQIKVKGHLRSTCKITWKCKFGLICIL